MKMTVLYLKDTGQVMAAVTRAALPADPAAVARDAAALAGAALPVRGFLDAAGSTVNATAFLIPADQLAALTVDADDDQLLAPRSYAVLDDKTLDSQPAKLPPIPTATAGDPSTVKVDLGADVTADLPISLLLVPVKGTTGPSPQMRGVFKPNSGTSKVIIFSVHPPLDGDFDALMLLKGYAVAVRRLTFGGLV